MKHFAISIFALMTTSTTVAQTTYVPTPNTSTKSWPCELLVCLAAPISPVSIPQCLPPIKRMFLHLLNPLAGFPGCTGSSADVNISRGLIGNVRSINAYDMTTTYPLLEFNDELQRKLSDPTIPDPYGFDPSIDTVPNTARS